LLNWELLGLWGNLSIAPNSDLNRTYRKPHCRTRSQSQHFSNVFRFIFDLKNYTLQESLADAKVSARQQCVYEVPYSLP